MLTKTGPLSPDLCHEEQDYLWDGEPFTFQIGPAVIHIKLSDLSARLYVDVWRTDSDEDTPMDTALLALPGGPETGEEV